MPVNIDPAAMKAAEGADPGGKYSVPYTWGTDGLGYNLTKVKTILGPNVPLDSWDILFDPKVHFQAVPLWSFRSWIHHPTFCPLRCSTCTKDPNSKNPADWQAGYELLKKIRPYITQV